VSSIAGDVGVARHAVMRSPAHRIHANMGVVFERRAHWEVPRLYGSQDQEVEALETNLGFADVSARGKIHLSGAVDALIRSLTGGALEPSSAASTSSGQGLVARIARDWALALTPPSGEDDVLAGIADGIGESLVTDITSAMSAYLVAGPRLEDFFARSVTLDTAELRPGRCAAITWCRIPSVLVMRDLPAPAVELYVSSDHGRYAWETICRLGAHLGGSPVGWQALETWGWK
jgi:glycine cleavage system aminomethyltransferase T